MEANNHGAGSKEAQDLEREIATAAHAAEDVIESHIVDQIHAGTSLRCSMDLQQKTQDMDAVMKKANEFEGKQGSGEEQPTTAIAMVEIGETAMVGLDAELEQLLDKLTFGHPSLHTISIVGMGGMGKTTLAKSIYENQLIKEYFHFHAWATISQQHSAIEILSQLLYGQGKSSNVADQDDLGLTLHQNLFGRRYLIILDDIWNVRAWDDVRHFFPGNNNGSRIVLTTRLLNVAKECGSSPFMMKFLDEDNSKTLFFEKALKNEACPLELKKVGEEIVKLCKGLALSIVVMGGLLLKSPKTVEYWKSFLKDIKSDSDDSSEKQESLDVLCLSYNHLPPHLKPCFLYMGVFQEDSEIRVSNVVKLWVAEGFIKPNGYQDLEEIGEGYIEDMIDRNLLMVGGVRKNGKIGSCSIHDLLIDLCIKIGEQQEFFHASGDESIQGSCRRLIVRHWNQIESQIPLIRSIMSIYTHECMIKGKLLRVLEYGGDEDSSAEIYGNVNLRYLAHKKSYTGQEKTLWKLPNAISLMWNLQTLIIRQYWLVTVVVAPTKIWKMRQLRHVDCPRIHLPRCNEVMNLENLRTLKTAVSFSLCEEACKSIPRIKKLYLLYERGMLGYDDGLIEDVCNLHRLDKLESLYLCFMSKSYPDLDSELNKKLLFPRSLKKLCLRHCLLEWEDLRVIGSLPQLQVLVLEYDSVFGREWSPVDGQFQKLKFLKIDNGYLEHWDADHIHFPVLEKLLLIDMDNLQEIPEGIGDIPTLQLIRVERCSQSAAISAVKIRQVQLDNGSDSLQIQVCLLESSEVEGFKERVDSEGLTISGIQLEC